MKATAATKTALIYALLVAGWALSVDLLVDLLLPGSALFLEIHIALSSAGALFFYLLLRRELRARERAEAGAQQARSDLEARVLERTGALALANAALHAEIAERMRIEQEREQLLRQYDRERLHSQALAEQARQRAAELEALLDSSRAVASTLELEPLLSLVLEQVRRMADYAGAMVYAAHNGRVIAVDLNDRTGGAAAPRVAFNAADGALDELLARCAEPRIIADADAAHGLARAFQGDPMRQHPGWSDRRSWLIIPLTAKDRAVGLLALNHPEPNHFSDSQMKLVAAIAQQAAVAVENARLFEQSQRMAALEERQRLARELHDSLSQTLYGIALGCHTALTLLDRDRDRVVQALDYTLALAGAGLTEMRALIFDLRPESLESEGLASALSKQAAAVRVRNDIDVEVTLCGEPEARLDVKETIYRIAQEALHNAVKHAQATRLILALSDESDALRIEITDNGIGFDPQASYAGHLGIRSMRERTSRLGGSVEISSQPGAGTRVVSRIPKHPAR
jgi:signal transduction histidine kinase